MPTAASDSPAAAIPNRRSHRRIGRPVQAERPPVCIDIAARSTAAVDPSAPIATILAPHSRRTPRAPAPRGATDHMAQNIRNVAIIAHVDHGKTT
ncbi:MAG: hypothetical protein JNK15_15820, partial [Planctomycetes bacterium]|nr:hypothetical protein [Planctomycetota bacterium]